MRTITERSPEAQTITQWVEFRCSICDQEWGEGAYSQHEHCALLYGDGTRRYAECITTARLGSGEVVRVISE